LDAIRVHEGPDGAAFVLVRLDEAKMGMAKAELMIVGASRLDQTGWDEAVRFCWGMGYEPRDDEPDVYLGSIDAEFYVLMELADEELMDDKEVEDGELHAG
jgi:hypothetical protein